MCVCVCVCVCVRVWPHELSGLRKETSSMRPQDHKANQYQDRNSYTPLRKVWISLRRLPQNSSFILILWTSPVSNFIQIQRGWKKALETGQTFNYNLQWKLDFTTLTIDLRHYAEIYWHRTVYKSTDTELYTKLLTPKRIQIYWHRIVYKSTDTEPYTNLLTPNCIQIYWHRIVYKSTDTEL